MRQGPGWRAGVLARPATGGPPLTAAAAVLGSAALGLLAVAWRFRWLSASGLMAAVAVGGAVWAGAGLQGLALLVLFFVSASVLTAWNPARAGRWPTDGEEVGTVASDRDGAGRSGRQVAANGGVAAGCALLGLAGWLPYAHYAVAGALAAATADTWATEVGTARAGVTRLITSWKRVPPGRSGGVSAAGSLAGLAGALLIGAAAALLFAPGLFDDGVVTRAPGEAGGSAGYGWRLVAPLAGGLAGMTVDSLLGASLEGRVRAIDNHAVNLFGTLAGAGVAWALAAMVSTA